MGIKEHTCPFCGHGDIHIDQNHWFCMGCEAIWNERAERELPMFHACARVVGALLEALDAEDLIEKKPDWVKD